MRPERLELPTLCLEGRCSIQLSYGRKGTPKSIIGARGFEPPTPCAQGRCATRLRYAPIFIHYIYVRECENENSMFSLMNFDRGPDMFS
jgi:hypothetical protein